MSRSGYSEDCYNLQLYRAVVDRALQGKRGQAFLKELVASLDALPTKRLIDGELINSRGECCAIGAVCKSRSVNIEKIDYEDPEGVANAMGVARCMAAEIAYMNDEWESVRETPEHRWKRMRKWAVSKLKPSPVASALTMRL